MKRCLWTTAQVTCSALVPARTCKVVSLLANDSLSRLLKSPVSMEVLSPNEYGKRKAEIRNEDDSTGRFLCDRSVPNPPCPQTQKLQEFYMTWTDNMMFTRDRDSQSSFPSKIIVSTDEFEHVLFDKADCPCIDTKEKDGKDTLTNKYGVVVIKDGVYVLDGKLSIDKVNEAMCFIEGYFNGLLSMGPSNTEIIRTR
jgi:hypothetical protein